MGSKNRSVEVGRAIEAITKTCLVHLYVFV
jgi:hypothetical protein